MIALLRYDFKVAKINLCFILFVFRVYVVSVKKLMEFLIIATVLILFNQRENILQGT